MRHKHITIEQARDTLKSHARTRTPLEIAKEALRAIRAARDYCAEHGEYPQNLEADQAFDDWAADVADTALTEMEQS